MGETFTGCPDCGAIAGQHHQDGCSIRRRFLMATDETAPHGTMPVLYFDKVEEETVEMPIATPVTFGPADKVERGEGSMMYKCMDCKAQYGPYGNPEDEPPASCPTCGCTEFSGRPGTDLEMHDGDGDVIATAGDAMLHYDELDGPGPVLEEIHIKQRSSEEKIDYLIGKMALQTVQIAKLEKDMARFLASWDKLDRLFSTHMEWHESQTDKPDTTAEALQRAVKATR